MEIKILCEGETEEIAVRYFVRRQWSLDGFDSIGLQPVNLRGKLETVFDRVPLYRQTPSIAAVFTLVDLHEFKRIRFGPYVELADKIKQAKDWLCDDFGENLKTFFHPHMSVHEVEAWILAEGKSIAKRLKADIQPEPNAEERNSDNNPAKRLDNLFKRHRKQGYQKTTDGVPLFANMDFQSVYRSCRYFRDFYDDLKDVGSAILKHSL